MASALWGSPPEDNAHGPNGPRNVVYGCDVSSPKSGLWMGGMNENWMILHNRFDVGKGPGVLAKTASFDHLIGGNVFVLRDPQASMLALRSPDCSGIEAWDNTVLGGNGALLVGPAQLAREVHNTLRREATDEMPQRPAPAVPSIFAWQREHVPWERTLPVR